MTLGGDPELIQAARAYETYVTGETLATSVAYDGAEAGEPATIEGRELLIAVARASYRVGKRAAMLNGRA